MNEKLIIASSIVCLLAAGCYGTEEDAEVGAIAEALELDNGGLEETDEAPAFGADEEFDALQLLVADPPAEDPMEADPEVAAMRAVPDAVVVRVGIEWGQIPGDRTNRVPRNWTGALVVNRGALLVHRTLRFEPATDRLLPRPNPQTLPFTSVTLPHHDGLALTIIDPTPEAAEPLTLAYINDLPGEAGPEGGALRVPVAALLDGPRELVSDAADNRMVAVAMARPVDVCQQGFMMGRWHRVAPGRGRIAGRVVNEEGELQGHIRGIYGHRRNGDQVFFGKYINADGNFQGIFAGHYDDGHYEGRWLGRGGERGALAGQYRETIPGPETGGHFIGRVAETSCNLRL